MIKNNLKPNYEVAIIEDGKIVKIYPQEQYNSAVIEQYRNNGSQLALNIGEIKPIYQETNIAQITQESTNELKKSLKETREMYLWTVIGIVLILAIQKITIEYFRNKKPKQKPLVISKTHRK